MRQADDALATDVDEIPDEWQQLKLEYTGNFKLKAKFALEADDGRSLDAVAIIRPRKSYDQPGFPDCHELLIRDYRVDEPPEKELIQPSISDSEHPHQALARLAKEARELLDDDVGDPPGELARVDELSTGDVVRVGEWTKPLVVVDTSVEFDPDLVDAPFTSTVKTAGWGGSKPTLAGRDEFDAIQVGSEFPSRIEHLRRVDHVDDVESYLDDE